MALLDKAVKAHRAYTDMVSKCMLVMFSWSTESTCISHYWSALNISIILHPVCGCAGHPRSSHRQTFARTEISGYWGPGRPARDIHGYLICCGTALQPLHQPGTVKQSSLLQGYVHVNKPLFAEQTLFNIQSNARTVPLTLHIFGDDQLTTMTLQIC